MEETISGDGENGGGRGNFLLQMRLKVVNKPAGRFNALLCEGQFFSDSPDQLDEFTNFNKGQS
ncbi:hypothetical protein RJ639_047103 [Escallonia herrerae]|uniref:Uncharacterized protein n=1 Tax=Escallonia herrerae TaxID=1293975 RepID=A0AA88W9B2_9ASTE|nr:hypothetical protein RJ639_047103 [Escallonia herrerae]